MANFVFIRVMQRDAIVRLGELQLLSAMNWLLIVVVLHRWLCPSEAAVHIRF
jgi:hypothetical protein